MILVKPLDVTTELEAIELQYDKLVAVVRYADSERALCTANDPKGFGYIVMNGRAARGLREQFVGDRWEADDKDNQPGIRNPHIKVRVIPCNFDHNTANLIRDPSNRTEKGHASRAKTQCNGTAWFPGMEPAVEEAEDGYTTYVLGMYSDEDGLKAELSRPSNFASGHYTHFLSRIILMNGEDSGDRTPHSGRGEGPTDIVDITVKRKNAQ